MADSSDILKFDETVVTRKVIEPLEAQRINERKNDLNAMLAPFAKPIFEVDKIIKSKYLQDSNFPQLAQPMMDKIFRFIKNNPDADIFDKLQFNALRVMQKGIIESLDADEKIIDQINTVLQEDYELYFWEKYIDDKTYMDRSMSFFPNAELVTFFNKLCKNTLEGEMNPEDLEKGVLQIMEFEGEINLDIVDDITRSFTDIHCDKKYLTKYFTAVNFVATFNAAKSLKDTYKIASKRFIGANPVYQNGLTKLFQLGLGGQINRQTASIEMIENPAMSQLKAWRIGSQSILTDSTFSKYFLSCIAFQDDATALEICKHADSIVKAIEKGATPLIRAYNNAGPMFDNIAVTREMFDRLYRDFMATNPSSQNFHGLIRFLDTLDIEMKIRNPDKPTEEFDEEEAMLHNVTVIYNQEIVNFFSRLLKDILESEYNPYLVGIDFRLPLLKQIECVISRIIEDTTRVNMSKLKLLSATVSIPKSAVKLIMGFLLLNYYNYKNKGEYDGKLKSVRESLGLKPRQEILKFFSTILDAQTMKSFFGELISRKNEEA